MVVDSKLEQQRQQAGPLFNLPVIDKDKGLKSEELDNKERQELGPIFENLSAFLNNFPVSELTPFVAETWKSIESNLLNQHRQSIVRHLKKEEIFLIRKPENGNFYTPDVVNNFIKTYSGKYEELLDPEDRALLLELLKPFDLKKENQLNQALYTLVTKYSFCSTSKFHKNIMTFGEEVAKSFQQFSKDYRQAKVVNNLGQVTLSLTEQDRNNWMVQYWLMHIISDTVQVFSRTEDSRQKLAKVCSKNLNRAFTYDDILKLSELISMGQLFLTGILNYLNEGGDSKFRNNFEQSFNSVADMVFGQESLTFDELFNKSKIKELIQTFGDDVFGPNFSSDNTVENGKNSVMIYILKQLPEHLKTMWHALSGVKLEEFQGVNQPGNEGLRTDQLQNIVERISLNYTSLESLDVAQLYEISKDLKKINNGKVYWPETNIETLFWYINDSEQNLNLGAAILESEYLDTNQIGSIEKIVNKAIQNKTDKILDPQSPEHAELISQIEGIWTGIFENIEMDGNHVAENILKAYLSGSSRQFQIDAKNPASYQAFAFLEQVQTIFPHQIKRSETGIGISDDRLKKLITEAIGNNQEQVDGQDIPKTSEELQLFLEKNKVEINIKNGRLKEFISTHGGENGSFFRKIYSFVKDIINSNGIDGFVSRTVTRQLPFRKIDQLEGVTNIRGFGELPAKRIRSWIDTKYRVVIGQESDHYKLYLGDYHNVLA